MGLAAVTDGRPAGNSFVSDIFNEVNEELRREQLKKLWERYGFALVALAVLIVVAVGGWRGYQWWQGQKAAASGVAFEAAATLAQQGKHEEAEAAFAKIATDGTPAYRVLAKLREAATLAERDQKAAVALYDAIAENQSLDQVQRDVAAMRAGYLLVDSASYDDIKSRLEPLAASDRTFRHSARALLALSAWHANNGTELKRWTDLVLGDAETPSNTRSQVEMLTALTGAAGKS